MTKEAILSYMYILFMWLKKNNKYPGNPKFSVINLKLVWVSDCYLIEQFFSSIIARTGYIWWDDVCLVLDQHTELYFDRASSLKLQSTGRHVAPPGYIILIMSQPVFVYSLVLCAYQRSSKYQFHGHWLDQTRSLTHNLPHSRWAWDPLQYRCGSSN